MGRTIYFNQFRNEDLAGMLKPIIYCNKKTCNFKSTYPLNHQLAEILINYDHAQRTYNIEKCILQCISSLPDNPIIEKFDVLFNPYYKIDVLQTLVNVCKIKPFSLIWPGIYQKGKLYYAEEGCEDYKVYDTNNYDITCII